MREVMNRRRRIVKRDGGRGKENPSTLQRDCERCVSGGETRIIYDIYEFIYLRLLRGAALEKLSRERGNYVSD